MSDYVLSIMGHRIVTEGEINLRCRFCNRTDMFGLRSLRTARRKGWRYFEYPDLSLPPSAHRDWTHLAVCPDCDATRMELDRASRPSFFRWRRRNSSVA